MSPEFKFLAACFGISMIVTYAWWCHFRAWILRARLFAIRDDLWDAMRAQGRLREPDHIKMRGAINALIAAASTMSWMSFLFILVTNQELKSLVTSDPVRTDIRHVRDQVGLCIADYLLRMTLTGRILMLFAVIFNFATDLKRSIAGVAGAMADARAFCPANG